MNITFETRSAEEIKTDKEREINMALQLICSNAIISREEMHVLIERRKKINQYIDTAVNSLSMKNLKLSPDITELYQE